MATFAENTSVPVVRSRIELEKLLTDRGAKRIGMANADEFAAVQFDYSNLRIRIKLPLPLRDDKAFTQKNSWRERSNTAAQNLWEQAMRARWRALLLSVKAKLVSVEAGVETAEQAFFASVVTASGKTIFEIATNDKDLSTRFDLKQLGAGK
jgi:hypothetical protein